MMSWQGGVIDICNSRVSVGFWTNLFGSVEQRLHSLGESQPVVYLLLHWEVDVGVLHAWAIPEDVFSAAVGPIPKDRVTGRRTIEISPEDHQLKHAPNAPSFAPFYVRADLTEPERAKLLEAIKTDDNVKQERLATADDETDADESDDDAIDGDAEDEAEPQPTYTGETVAFVEELGSHTEDKPWHEQNKRRYERVLRDPSRTLVDELRSRYIARLNPAVASGKRHLSILKKNDYGKGGYHDYYWFAFYDPAAGSKTKSVQLFLFLSSKEQNWNYGLSMGRDCPEYAERLATAIEANRDSIARYVRHAPPGAVVRLSSSDNEEEEFSGTEFAEWLMKTGDGAFVTDTPLTNFNIIREYPLATLPDHAETLVDEIGEFFTWVWPFFDAAVTGTWPASSSVTPLPKPSDEEMGEVDEQAPITLAEVSEVTAISPEFLDEFEDALLAKQQAILVGPPGTSKTYLARQFARYFVRQNPGRPQGKCDVLYMHASWAYEDFFEGLKPTTSKNGSLIFEPRLGFFLKWVAELKDYSAKARHVLVLDEINRCDTAAVLGELLQLLEYRGTTVRLLSGRSFVFPDNLYIIGTMNSADRSIGRLDLALRRRFLWLDLHPQPKTLDRWLKRPGNNPLGFDAVSLVRCNELLAEHGIPPDQQIGHALFMLQRRAEDDEASPNLDIPLSAKQLRQIVRFSVLPYVRELLTMQFGQADSNLLQNISEMLLQCVDGPAATSQQESIDDAQPQT